MPWHSQALQNTGQVTPLTSYTSVIRSIRPFEKRHSFPSSGLSGPVMCRQYSWTCANCSMAHSMIIRCRSPTARLHPCQRRLPVRGHLPDRPGSILRCSRCRLFTDQSGLPVHDPSVAGAQFRGPPIPALNDPPAPAQAYHHTPETTIDPRLLSLSSDSAAGSSQAPPAFSAPPIFPAVSPLSDLPPLPTFQASAPAAPIPHFDIRTDTAVPAEVPIETQAPPLPDHTARLEAMQQARDNLFQQAAEDLERTRTRQGGSTLR